MFTSGPPELPGLMAASVCRKSSNGPCPIWRALALMIPAVTVACSPNGDDPVAHLQPVGVTHAREGELALAVVQLEDGQVGLLVQADHLRLVLVAVERDDLHLAGLLHDVGVGERDARGVDDDARAQAALRNPLRHVAEEAAEELLAEELLERRPAADPGAAGDGVDVDDGRLDRLGHLGEGPGGERHLHRQDGRLHHRG
jgi:hypothetical protein